ncbi:MAG: DNA gyrase inhibitor YacG [Pelagibacteraceae bacterium]|jgi:endogenous inhibitor of DNA gyrase (YacG/DUF329 family)|nr:DNA gyrase inhibitor YacG [Pelagibacteraceae bacterium]MBO6467606.1 DNA gyrase inhibitor YacG [Pelagibacteraceae bacterium]MBO6468947.1 DNA gyrase inhibitor YacG [Pelagibacteraceae bacterium]MBO6469620.1 DNA gyrase inhibitor YacG [Pelagibacteraceae bacterium]MBO6471553.1 DNA gyrase inhibitor YacG [Pelagibacteraceae bacterium]|tara:strand:+ start:764 stop:946 length:183 start_codon:yes stop_codon:yes gene_type:complete
MEIKNSTKNKITKLNRIKTKCPVCKKRSIDPFTPFCSKKCSNSDLIKWLSNENYINLDLE